MEHPFCIKLSFKKLKSFQNLLFGNHATFWKIYFYKLSQTTTLCKVWQIRKKIWQKLIPQNLVLANINSLEVVAQVSFSVFWFLTLKLSKLCISKNSSDWWRDFSVLLTWPKLFFWSIHQKPVMWSSPGPYYPISGTWNTRRSVHLAPTHPSHSYWYHIRKKLYARSSLTDTVSCETCRQKINNFKLRKKYGSIH